MIGLEQLLSRRDFVGCSAAAAASASLSGWIHPLAAEAAQSTTRHKSCVVVWTDGGLSQLESFDMKPGYSLFDSIETSLPGLRICDRLPKLAALMHHATVIRTMCTEEQSHGRAAYLAHTGVRRGPVVYPSLGAIASMELGKPDFPLPNYACITSLRHLPTGARSGFLGPGHAPLGLRNLEKGIANLRPAVQMQQFDDRYDLLSRLDKGFAEDRKAAPVAGHLATLQRAKRLMQSQESKAFDLSLEPEKSRESYGDKYGQGVLLARRLIEVGVPFVEVTVGGSWDNYSGAEYHERYLPPLDMALSSLIADLNDRGLLDTTLIVLMGEFGRGGRKLTNGSKERNHWNRAWSTVLFGGGIKAGQIIGKTDDGAQYVEDRPVSIRDFFATICSILGIDYTKENTAPGGRPIRIVDDGNPITEILPAS